MLDDKVVRDCDPLDLVWALAGTPEPAWEPWGGPYPPPGVGGGWLLVGEGSLACPGAPSSVSRGACSLSFTLGRIGFVQTKAISPAHFHSYHWGFTKLGCQSMLWLSPSFSVPADTEFYCFCPMNAHPCSPPSSHPNSDPMTFPWNISPLALPQCISHTPPRGNSIICKLDHVISLF